MLCEVFVKYRVVGDHLLVLSIAADASTASAVSKIRPRRIFLYRDEALVAPLGAIIDGMGGAVNAAFRRGSAFPATQGKLKGNASFKRLVPAGRSRSRHM